MRSRRLLDLSISTENYVYRSNETLEIHLEFFSEKDGKAEVAVSGIRNEFGRALVSETRNAAINKGTNEFDFVFTTPSCKECSALSPGAYTLNATVNFGGKTFETYKTITLERGLE